MIRHSDFDESPSLPAAVRRHSKKALTMLLLCAGAAVAYTAISPSWYGSEAKLFVRLGHESVSLDPTATTGQTVSVQDSRESELNSVFELINSRMVLEKVVDDLGPAFVLTAGSQSPASKPDGQAPASMIEKVNPFTVYSSRDDAVQKLAKRLSVTNAKKSNVFTISCEAQSPEAARLIVEKVIDTARDAYTRVNRIAGSVDFFAERTESERKQLDGLEHRLRDLKDRTGVSALDTQRELQLKQIGALEEQQRSTERALKAAAAQHDAIERQLARQEPSAVTAETTGMVDTAADKMRDRLYSLEIEQHELESRETSQHPQLAHVKDEVASARQTLRKEVTPPQITKGENRTYKDLELAMYHDEASAASLKAENATLGAQIADARRDLKSINATELEIAGLQREIDASRATYRRYTDNLEQATIDQALATERISNINILQQPTVSYTPIRPRAAFNLAAGIGLGLVLAMAIVAWSESRRRAVLMPLHNSIENGHGNGNGNGQGNGNGNGHAFRERVIHAK
jgi:uncharacterized protein involved in exopolysaccharide biosynthesis